MVEADAYVSAKALREVYEAWCSEQGERPWTAKALGAELSDCGFDTAGWGTRRLRSWLGLGLASEGADG